MMMMTMMMMMVKKEDNDSKKKTITYRLNFIYSYRLMPIKLSELIDNLKSTIKNANHAWKRRKLGRNVNLLNLKMTD